MPPCSSKKRMKMESFQPGLYMSALTSETMKDEPLWILLPVPGCSSEPTWNPGSMNATEGRLPFATSTMYCEIGKNLSRCFDMKPVKKLNSESIVGST